MHVVDLILDLFEFFLRFEDGDRLFFDLEDGALISSSLK
jgi:hypothetical protein